jgi:hypothetical protein
VSKLGNYAKLYARHLEPSVPRRGLNTIYTMGKDEATSNESSKGQLFAMPFGDIERRLGPGPHLAVYSI